VFSISTIADNITNPV